MIKFDPYTTTEAIDNIAVVDDPDSVTDVVFQIGFNDTRRGLSTERIRENLLETQLLYNRRFRNARQHLTGLPPLSDAQVEVNGMLNRLALHTGSNIISTKQFRDRNTGQMRSNLMNGIHYNEVGIRILAKEMKKSLYSDANIGNGCLTMLNNLAQVDCTF